MDFIYHVVAFLAGATFCWGAHKLWDWIERIRLRRAYKAVMQYMNEQETELWEWEKEERE